MASNFTAIHAEGPEDFVAVGGQYMVEVNGFRGEMVRCVAGRFLEVSCRRT